MTKDEALEKAIPTHDYLDGSYEAHKVRKACQEALEQPAQSPVAEISEGMLFWNQPVPDFEDGIKLYTQPQAKEWVGLNRSEIVDIIIKMENKTMGDLVAMARDVEQALKDKNT
jgi:hypothetical protein